MAHALLTHDGHALVNGLFWLCNDDVSFHDVPHGRCGRRLTLENNIPRIVPFGDDANEFVAFHHYQRSNVFFSHFRDGIEDGSIRVNRPNVPALLIKQLSHRSHLDPPSDTSPSRFLIGQAGPSNPKGEGDATLAGHCAAARLPWPNDPPKSDTPRRYARMTWQGHAGSHRIGCFPPSSIAGVWELRTSWTSAAACKPRI